MGSEMCIRDRKEDELASVFVTKMEDQVLVCEDYLHEALSQLMAIGSGHIHGDATTTFEELDHGEVYRNNWVTTTPLPVAFGPVGRDSTTTSTRRPSTPTTAWNVVARPGDDWGDVLDLGPGSEISKEGAPQYDTYRAEEVDGLADTTDLSKGCSVQELVSREFSDSHLKNNCGLIYVPEVMHGSGHFNPSGVIAAAYHKYRVTGNLTILREAYRQKEQNGSPLSENFLTRIARQIATGLLAGVGIVGGMALGSKWDELKHFLGIGGESTMTQVSHVVNNDSRFIKILGKHVGKLEQSAIDIHDDLEDFAHYENLEDEYDKIVALRQQVFSVYDRFKRGIAGLVSSSKINPNLIDTSVMYEQLTRLTGKLRLQFKGLLLTDRSQVWEMDTSYLLYSNYSIVIFVHLPVGDASLKMSLVEYLPTPLRLGTDPQTYTIHVEKTMMAVGSSKHHLYKELSQRDISRCTRSGKHYFCPKRSMHEYDVDHSCLSSLYWQDPVTSIRTCPLKPVPHRDLVTQLNPTEFIVSIEGVEDLRFYCRGFKVGTLKAQGILRLKIPRNCNVEGRQLDLKPTLELHWNIGNVTQVPVDMMKSINDTLAAHASDSVYQIHSGVPGPSIHELGQDFKEEILKTQETHSIWDTIHMCIAGVAGLILLVFFIKIITVCCVNKRVTGKFRTARADADHRDRKIEELERHIRQMSALLQHQLDHDYAEIEEPPVVERRALLTGGSRPAPVPRVKFLRNLETKVDSASYIPATINAEIHVDAERDPGANMENEEDEARV